MKFFYSQGKSLSGQGCQLVPRAYRINTRSFRPLIFSSGVKHDFLPSGMTALR